MPITEKGNENMNTINTGSLPHLNRGDTMKNSQKRSAFTLIEIMVVIIILGMLAAFVIPNITGKSEEAKQKLVCIQMKSLSEGLKMFKIDNGSYPTTEEGLAALISNPSEEATPRTVKTAISKGKSSRKTRGITPISISMTEPRSTSSLWVPMGKRGEVMKGRIRNSPNVSNPYTQSFYPHRTHHRYHDHGDGRELGQLASL
jgi:prepilin-type N-terminal cleavage/methylation domain-containing protein